MSFGKFLTADSQEVTLQKYFYDIANNPDINNYTDRSFIFIGEVGEMAHAIHLISYDPMLHSDSDGGELLVFWGENADPLHPLKKDLRKLESQIADPAEIIAEDIFTEQEDFLARIKAIVSQVNFKEHASQWRW